MANRYVEPAPGDQITRAGVALVPLRLLSDCVEHKEDLFVYTWLCATAETGEMFDLAEGLLAEGGLTEEQSSASVDRLVKLGWLKNTAAAGEPACYYIRSGF